MNNHIEISFQRDRTLWEDALRMFMGRVGSTLTAFRAGAIEKPKTLCVCEMPGRTFVIREDAEARQEAKSSVITITAIVPVFTLTREEAELLSTEDIFAAAAIDFADAILTD